MRAEIIRKSMQKVVPKRGVQINMTFFAGKISVFSPVKISPYLMIGFFAGKSIVI